MSKSFLEQFDPKQAFWMGLLGGLGVMFAVGFFIMLGLYFSDGTSAKTAKTNTAPTAAAPTNPAPTPTNSGTPPQITDADWSIGPEDAPVTIIEFSDIQCPFCERFHPTVEQIMNEYDGQVRWVYKHFPLDSLHPQARPAAEASECLGDQLGDEAFFDYIAALFSQQGSLSRSLYVSEAVKLGANESEFTSCLDSGTFKQAVQDDYQQGLASGVTGTPGSFINNQPIRGALPYEQVKAVVEQELNN